MIIPTLETVLLGKHYPTPHGHVQVLRGISLRVEAGQTVAVVGPAGAGKTTLLNLIAGVDRPTRGTVYLGGLDLREVPRCELAQVRGRHVGVVTRKPHFLPEHTLLENVAWPRRQLPAPDRESAAGRALFLLSRVGLAGRAAALPHELDPAEQQRAAIARAFVNRPLVVVADEPAADLDPAAAQEVLSLLQELAREEGAALLIATREPEAPSAPDQVLRLPEEGIAPLAVPGAVPAGPPPTRAEILRDAYARLAAPLTRPLAPAVELMVRPALYALAVAVLITFACFFGGNLAGALQSPGYAGRSAMAALQQTVGYLSDAVHGDLGAVRSLQAVVNYWEEGQWQPVRPLVAAAALKSLPLLALALVLAAAVGVPLGVGTALARRSRLSLSLTALALVGVSIPSFALACLLWYGEIVFYRRTGVRLVPIAGFGLDEHLILPVLVLAARPVAQVARVSFVALTEVLGADYIRTARAKGLAGWAILTRHALRNAGVPVLAALTTSLRFALSSLPVVETIFAWPGLGQLLLRALVAEPAPQLAAAAALALGLGFVLVTAASEAASRALDPRLALRRSALGPQRRSLDLAWTAWQALLDLPLQLRRLWHALAGRATGRSRGQEPATRRPALGEAERDRAMQRERRRVWLQHTLGSPSFVAGALILAALTLAYAFGANLAPQDPGRYFTLQQGRPPYPPSAQFPFGTDQLGRDILSLLLAGARQTLSVALVAGLARVAAGALLGALAGWFAGSLLDRALMAVVQVLAAFPAMLLAVVIIKALGIERGTGVFIVALCTVGWGECAQFVRQQVLSLREREYVEGALAVGLGDWQILLRQILPNLFPVLVVLACLEMGGAMILLGELGFIGIFIGGGVRVELATEKWVLVSDVPEWGAMLSDTWRYFRSYPWTGLYPALAFALTLVGLNLAGEGVRRLCERLTVRFSHVVNRYTLGAVAAVLAVSLIAGEAASPWRRCQPLAGRFDPVRALAHVQALAAPAMEGRRSGTPALERAAAYIAGQFASLGLQPAGEREGANYSFFCTFEQDYYDLTAAPSLSLRTASGHDLGAPAYAQDYLEYHGYSVQGGSASGEVVWAVENLRSFDSRAPWLSQLSGRIVLVPDHPWFVQPADVQAVLVVAGPSLGFQKRDPFAQRHLQGEPWRGMGSEGAPHLYISPQLADRILAESGHTLDELQKVRSGLRNGVLLVETGVTADLDVPIELREAVATRDVLAMLPGTDDQLDEEAIFVTAHYDGLGIWPDGALFCGANDNASGVGVMLEAARVLKEAGFAPRRTIFFLAYATGERDLPPDLARILAARPGFAETYRVSGVIEVQGVGAGTGKGLSLQGASGGRLAATLGEAARREGIRTTSTQYVLHSLQGYRRDRSRPPYILLSWQGSEDLQHGIADTPENVDPAKLARVGRVLALSLMRMAGEGRY